MSVVDMDLGSSTSNRIVGDADRNDDGDDDDGGSVCTDTSSDVESVCTDTSSEDDGNDNEGRRSNGVSTRITGWQ